MSELTKTRRQDLILQYLRGLDSENALTISEIAKRIKNEGIKVSGRTVRRDIEELSCDYGILSTETYPERFYLSQDFEFNYQINLSEKHLQVLLIALNSFKHTSHNYFEKYTNEIETAFWGMLPDQMTKKMLAEKEHYFFDYSLSGKAEKSNLDDFEKVMRAIREKKVIHCQNNSPYKDEKYNKRRRRFAPFIFALTSGIPYVICRDMEDQQIKRLRVTRMTNVEVSEEAITGPIPKELEKLKYSVAGWGSLTDEPIDVLVHCDAYMARYFKEKRIHQSQELKQIDDNSYELSFRCNLSHDLIRMLASFGEHLHAITPSQVFEDVKMIWENALKKAS